MIVADPELATELPDVNLLATFGAWLASTFVIIQASAHGRRPWDRSSWS
jgi:hypothetical protein